LAGALDGIQNKEKDDSVNTSVSNNASHNKSGIIGP